MSDYDDRQHFIRQRKIISRQIEEKEIELAKLRAEYRRNDPDDDLRNRISTSPTYRCMATIEGDIIRLETTPIGGGDSRRHAFRLLVEKSELDHLLARGFIREVESFRADANLERAYMPSWVPSWDCPAITTLQIKWADGETFVSRVEPLDDEWTRAAKGVAQE